MHITGVLVQANPKKLRQVRSRLATLPGVEIHAVTEEGRMVVTVEGDSDRDMAETFDRFNKIDGVISAAMVYHHFESDPEREASQ